MSYASSLLRSGLRRLLIMQGLIVLLIGGMVSFRYGQYHAISAVYGGVLAMLVALLLGWRVQKVGVSGKMDGGLGELHLYIGALERFVLVALGVWAGMGWLRLPPFPLIAGFTAAQAGYFFKMPDHS